MENSNSICPYCAPARHAILAHPAGQLAAELAEVRRPDFGLSKLPEVWDAAKMRLRCGPS